METKALIEAYYDAFNDNDSDAMLALLADDVVHDVNQGERRTGKAAFAEFNAKMAKCYAERLTDIAVMVGDDETRAAAEFTVNGFYIATDEGLPKAENQRYLLPAGAFFEVAEGQITRVTTYYNLENWLAQIKAGG